MPSPFMPSPFIPVEPVHAEALHAEPVHAEAVHAEPVHVGPAPSRRPRTPIRDEPALDGPPTATSACHESSQYTSVHC